MACIDKLKKIDNFLDRYYVQITLTPLFIVWLLLIIAWVTGALK